MPLTSLGVMPQYLEQVRKGATGPTPLDAIEARRASRAKEELDRYAADSDRLKALAAFQTAGTGASKEAREVQLSEEAQAIWQAAFGHLAGMDGPEMVQGIRQGVARALASGNPEVIKKVNDIPALLGQVQDTSPWGTGTQTEAARAASVTSSYAAANQANTTADLNRSLITKPGQGPSKESLVWAQGLTSTQDPGKQTDWDQFWNPAEWAMFKRNYTPDELVQKSYELAAILDIVQREYSATHGYAQMPFEEAKAEAMRRFKAQEKGGGYTPPEEKQGGKRKIIYSQ